MDKINLANIIKSYFLGVFIGFIIQLNGDMDIPFKYWVIILMSSGSVGFIIGFITEVLTALLPVSIAMTKTYFIINNLISLIVAALIMSLSVYIMNDELQLQSDFFQVVVMVLSIIFVANLVDYMRYRKSQIHLLQYKKSMRQK